MNYAQRMFLLRKSHRDQVTLDNFSQNREAHATGEDLIRVYHGLESGKRAP